MTEKMQVNRLNQDELVYELRIRGIGTGTVDQMRHSPAMAIKLEKSGSSLRWPTYPYSVEEDVEAVAEKLQELGPLVTTFNDGDTSRLFLKLQSKLTHTLNRIEHIDEASEDRPTLLARTLSLLDSLHMKAEEYRTAPAVPPQLGLVEQAQTPLDSSSSIQGRQQAEPSVRVALQDTVKPILPHKWNLKFSGEKKGQSLNAFLERVEELRLARHVPKEVLLESGIDLFSGRAYQFYLAYRKEVATWDELVGLLKEEYLSSNYNERLFEQIRGRTQGPSESIGIYLAVMTGYFNRLTCPISEDAKLKILMRNIAPFYQTQLALVEVTSVAHLRELGRRLEDRKEAVENFASPLRRSNALEPDLAYIEVSEPSTSSSEASAVSVRSENSRSSVVCYRCNQPGHRAIGCAMGTGKFCYKCKKEGVTIRTCPDCSSQGNDQQHT